MGEFRFPWNLEFSSLQIGLKNQAFELSGGLKNRDFSVFTIRFNQFLPPALKTLIFLYFLVDIMDNNTNLGRATREMTLVG